MKYRRLLCFIGTLTLCVTAPGFAAPANTDLPQRNAFRYQLDVTTASGDRHHIGVIGWNHEITSPRDAASGLPAGKRQHEPFAVTRAVGRVSPLIFELLTGSEEVTTWTMNFWKPGHSVRHHLLSNAAASSAKPNPPGCAVT